MTHEEAKAVIEIMLMGRFCICDYAEDMIKVFRDKFPEHGKLASAGLEAYYDEVLESEWDKTPS